MRKLLLAGTALGCLIWGSAASAGLLTGVLGSTTSVLGLVIDDPVAPSGSDVNPYYGAINPFYGSINPFYGAINPFYGHISPFWGDISPFWGNINPFTGNYDAFYGDVNTFWGKTNPFDPGIGPFWQKAGPEWGTINTTWGNLQSANTGDYSTLMTQLKDFLSECQEFWGPAVLKYTGKNFADGFETAMLAKYGIDPKNPSSLAKIDPVVRSAFFLNWYDGLMNFTGVDHVDWWMAAVDWSPALSDAEGSMYRPVVGILDSTFTAAGTDVQSIEFIGGYNIYVNEHGAAVASLIAAAHDGTGVMGVAPNVDIHLDNPFDQTGTANWTDVENGISALYASGAHVVNASLGVPGWTLDQQWINILSGPLLSGRAQDLVIVKAAGNEGVAQTTDVPWLPLLQTPNNLLIVGSVGPTGRISSFSNTPGSACLTVLGLCSQQNKLMYHYLVAPGELMLVSDGQGGVTRMTGTSFAAPLVTGAVALLQARWPWLQQHAPETVQIILQSAKDLGAPGVDPVYGWGELDIAASQSPLNFNNLVVYQPFIYNGSALNPLQTLLPNWSAQSLKQSILVPGQLSLWQNEKAYLVALEPIGSTYRDFTIPLSNMLVGKSQKTANGNNLFQSYLYQRLVNWANGASFSNFSSQSAPLLDGAWKLAVTTTMPSTEEQRETGIMRAHYEVQLSSPSEGIDFRMGEGSGGHGLVSELMSGQTGAFSLTTDFDPSTGGVNPVLGLASGGAYAQGGMTIGGFHFSAGYTQKTDDHTYLDPTFGPTQTVGLPTNRAAASMFGVDYNVGNNVALNVSYTALDEFDGLLGAQGGGVLSLRGARTGAATIGATAGFDGGWTIAASATLGDTTAADTHSALSFTSNNLHSTAYELVGKKTGIFGEKDELRLSVTQPLHIENGAMRFTSVEVTDRKTGALGPKTQTWSISGAREHRLEAMYAVPVLNDRADIAGFGLVDMNGPDTEGQSTSLTVGAQVQVNF